MASRPQNVGIKAMEIYFPSQASSSVLAIGTTNCAKPNYSASTRQNWKSSMAYRLENTQLAWGKRRWAFVMIEKVRLHLFTKSGLSNKVVLL